MSYNLSKLQHRLYHLKKIQKSVINFLYHNNKPFAILSLFAMLSCTKHLPRPISPYGYSLPNPICFSLSVSIKRIAAEI